MDANKGSRLLRKGRRSWVNPIYFITSFIAPTTGHIDNQDCFDILVNELKKLENEKILFYEALVVMPDHIHMLVRLGSQKKIGQAMKLFKGRTAREINRRLNTTGPVWYEGYHDHLLRPEEPVSNFVGYIELNPVKKALCKSPAEWPYLIIKIVNEKF